MGTPAIDALGFRSSRIVAYTFACVAGYVDAYALIRFQIYSSFMSGNTTRAGVEAATNQFSAAGLSLAAIAFFVVGAFIGVMIIQSRSRLSNRLASMVSLGLLAVQAAIDLTANVSSIYSIMLLSLSMGTLNAAISQIGGQPINIGYVSGGLHKIAEHLASAYYGLPVDSCQGAHDTHLRRAGLILGLWGVFLLGAFAGAVMQGLFPLVTLSLPMAAILTALLWGDFDAEST